MKSRPESSDRTTTAVRAGVRLGRGSSSDATPPVTTKWQSIVAFGRRQVDFARSLPLRFAHRSEQQLLSALLQRTDFLPPTRALRLSEREVIAGTPYGWLLVPAEDEGLLSMMADAGVLEPGTTMVMTRLIREGDTVIDIGANIGLLTLPAARRVGSAGKVIAVEPVPRVADLLQRSAYLNGVADRVQVETCACAAKAGSARIHLTKVCGHSSLLPLDGSTDSIDVRLRPLDDIVSHMQPVTLVKIDAEGYELEVWRGMQRVVSDNPELAVIVEFGPSHLRRAGVSIQEWLHEFVSRDFRPYEIDENSGRCAPLREHGLEDVFSMNLLLLRRAQRDYPDIEFA